MRRRGAALSALVVALGLSLGPAPAIAAGPAWTTYHHDSLRSGVDPDSGSPVPPSQAWQSPVLDEDVYAEPLLYGSMVYVATENDSVYALDAATGAIVWQASAGTAVDAGQLPCGDIGPHVGITGTPVIDPSTNRIYVVADSWDGSDPSTIHHQLVSFDLSTGAASAPVNVDPPGSDHTALLQRPGLALDGHEIVIGFGGNSGDCGSYHGWLVGVQESGSGGLSTFEATPGSGDYGGAVWGSGNAPAVDSAGNIYAATGNGFTNPGNPPGGAPSSFDFSESVLKLGPGLGAPLDYWAPSNWQDLDASDADIGSSEPLPLPGGLLFQAGKDGNAYLVRSGSMGHEGATPAAELDGICSASTMGGGLYYAGTIYAACEVGLVALSLDSSSSPPSLAPDPAFNTQGEGAGPPVFAGGLVWSADWNNGTLYGFDPHSGEAIYRQQLGTFMHFATPSAGGGRLFVAAEDQGGSPRLFAFQIANYAPPASARLTLSGVSLSRRRFRARRGTTLRLTVSEAATVTVAITRRVKGRRVKGTCRVHAKRGKRCTASVVKKRFTFAAHAGQNSFKLRLRGLRAGRYEAVVTALAAGSRATATVSLRITRR